MIDPSPELPDDMPVVSLELPRKVRQALRPPFCVASRCMNIPARYCTGYLGDIGVPVDPNPMDFSGWYEVFLDGRWFTMDARHNHPRIDAS